MVPENGAFNSPFSLDEPQWVPDKEVRVFVTEGPTYRALYAEPSRDRVTTLPFTPMETSPLH